MKTSHTPGANITWSLALASLVAAMLVGATLPAALPGAALAAPQAAEPPSPAPGSPGLPSSLKIEPALLKEALLTKNAELRFIAYLYSPQPALGAQTAGPQAVVSRLQATAQSTQAALVADLSVRQSAGQVQAYTSLWIANAVAVTADAETLFAVSARPEVRIVRPDRKRPWISDAPSLASDLYPAAAPVEWNIRQIRADEAWAALGLDGTGIVVANMDTGVDWLHPALQERYRGYNPHGPANHDGNWFDATSQGYLYPGDGHGHGTHTMGIVTGGGGIGVAPGARWIAVKVFDNYGSAYDSWIHAGFQWILAPGGNPALAPQVVSNSWGNDNGLDETFRADLAAWRAAGIFSTFSAGNAGPAAASVGSPASLPEALAVGATDSSDLIALFSARGPSPWGEVKPQLTAPGVNVRSSTPGGAYRVMDGTSMASPHAAGVAALILQAHPGLSITDTAYLMTSTAVPLRPAGDDAIPNNTYGWGRLDALAAAGAAASIGVLSGTVRAQDGFPVAGATVTAVGEVGGRHGAAQSDALGRYTLPLAAGAYTVTAGAFGYITSDPARVELLAGAATSHDFSLAGMPIGILRGRVLEEPGGLPLSATVSISGTALSAATDPTTGVYSLVLPEGAYTAKAASWGHRVVTQAGLTITAGLPTTVDFFLPAGPNILLVDSGAWYNDSHAPAYQTALDSLGYLYATRPITDTGLLPRPEELSPYDVVIWSAPQDAPGYIHADPALRTYLDQGGRLLISGQDVAFWDGGGGGLFSSNFLPTYLHARYVADSSGIESIQALPVEPFAGITLTLNTAGSDLNQLYPDVVAAADDRAAAVLAYAGDGTAGLRAEVCLPYRVVYLSFGLEGAGPPANRLDLLDKAVGWLMAARPDREARLSPPEQLRLGSAAASVTGTVTLWNTGRLTDTYDLSLTGAAWPTALWDQSFGQPQTSPVSLPACARLTAGVSTTIPFDAPRGVASTAVLAATSRSAPSVSPAVSVTAKTPAALLLVDDDRWYEVEGAYQSALGANGLDYDLWDTRGSTAPALSTLRMYPAVLWFTGYDWYEPLTGADEAALSRYLDGGGRLFLSAQDYMFVSKLTGFGLDYLGVLTYTDDITASSETGVIGHPIGDGLGPYTLTLPYHEWTDIVTPTASARTAFLNKGGSPTAVTLDQGTFKTVFFSFPFEGLPPAGRNEVMRRIVAWFDPLRASTFTVDRDVSQPGGEPAYALIVSNPGQVTATVRVTNTLPSALSLLPGTLQNAAYDPPTRAIVWAGALPPHGQRVITYRGSLQPSFRGALDNMALIQDDGSGSLFTRTATTRVPYVYYLPLIAKP